MFSSEDFGKQASFEAAEVISDAGSADVFQAADGEEVEGKEFCVGLLLIGQIGV